MKDFLKDLWENHKKDILLRLYKNEPIPDDIKL